MTLISLSLAYAGADPTIAVRTFVQGGDTRDAAVLEAVLHPSFRVVAQMPDGLKVMDRKVYLSLIDQKKIGGVPRETTLHTVLLQGDLATVRGTLASSAATFDCTWTLARSGDTWQVLQDAVVFRPQP